MKIRSLVNTVDISPEIAYIGEYRLRRKERVKVVDFCVTVLYRLFCTSAGEAVQILRSVELRHRGKK